LTVTCIAITALGQGHLQAAVINGGFESGSLSGWNSLGNVSVSSGISYGVAGSVLPDTGSFAARLIAGGQTAGTLASAMGISESALEASNQGVNAFDGSLVSQTISAIAGDKLQFRWNFAEKDGYLNGVNSLLFDDWAFFGIQFNGNPTEVSSLASVAGTGPTTGCTVGGWETLTVDITDSGDYTFYFGVVNGIDGMQDSELWLDGGVISGISAVPEPGSLLGLGLLLSSGVWLRSRRSR
jgi:hypothetical protein